ncbi:hypothetical protein BAUCODRAFT_30957 [Baudoinia panamericana UAMH 10762]|uniref:Uncharacterized protein n=1 Tax=Baudoinia panamericana (strain UAMH 10762) TaxID=717646 RepID=M2MPL2_BAUPA|nr:uncharacterized protein BAUCODRAFT_30957 [Baudoinia panamericana UAMH 10762]EMC98691.1 hypothetical protein BAUCODRAFT_30957 [Baudoinia panamericana UAMH 10762]
MFDDAKGIWYSVITDPPSSDVPSSTAKKRTLESDQPSFIGSLVSRADTGYFCYSNGASELVADVTVNGIDFFCNGAAVGSHALRSVW